MPDKACFTERLKLSSAKTIDGKGPFRFEELKRRAPLWYYVHWFVGNLRRFRRHTRRTWPGSDPSKTTNDHAIYAHYDREGVIHDYVVEQLRQLAAAGFRVTFVSNARRKIDAYVPAIVPFCRQVIWRSNVGYDFGAYKDGIAAIGDLRGCGRLLLMNDSAYGPFWPLRDVLDSADPSQSDFWGITDSWEEHFHIQSYFILFFSKALASSIFRKFWRQFPYVNSKTWIIHNGEIKLTQILTQNKLRAAVLCPYWDVARSVLEKIEAQLRADSGEPQNAFLRRVHNDIQFGRPVNPMHYFFDTLIAEFRCPFIKRELVRENPQRILCNWRWPELIDRVSAYDLDLIRHHLQAS